MKISVALALIIAFSGTSAALAQDPFERYIGYDVKELHACPAEDMFEEVGDINDATQITARIKCAYSDPKLVLFDSDGSHREIAMPPDADPSGFSAAKAVSDAGHVAGFYSTSSVGRQAFFWNGLGGAHALTPGVYSTAQDLTINGLIFGNSPVHTPVVWYPAGATFSQLELPLPNGFVSAYPKGGLNSLGIITGYGLRTLDGSGGHKPIVWKYGIAQQLGNYFGGAAQDVNDHGTVVGHFVRSTGESGLFLWEGGDPMDLEEHSPIAPYTHVTVEAINNNGVVVGTFGKDDPECRAMIFSPSSGVHDLNSLILNDDLPAPLCNAVGINNRDKIVGMYYTSEQPHGYLAQPVLLGDTNCDGNLSVLDIDPFVLALVSGKRRYLKAYAECYYETADVNRDGSVNTLDIEPFINLISQ